MKRKYTFIILSLVFGIIFILSGCNQNELEVVPTTYEFEEPTTLPFHVDKSWTSINIYPHMNQFVFHYRNLETKQQINYIVSKFHDLDDEILKERKTELTLTNGQSAFYEERNTTQSIWWYADNGFTARFVYYIDNNSIELEDLKLEVGDLIDLVNQVISNKVKW